MRMLDVESVSLEEVGFQDEDSILAEMRSRDGTWPEEISSLSTGRGVSREQPAVPGVTGLNNLGNTCYMNAALQVVSSTRILANYFKLNCHLFELNRSNPLGMKGHIAKRYGDLVRDMWSGETRTIAPIKLRWTIGKYQAAFSSFQQQDSQELLAFLLDGLHEDLNRVTDKPYVELKDSEGRPDLAVAAEAWENHSLRNRSIIVDLFHGQLKSKVTCKVCGHESVRCDPFFTLSLPLPMERCISLEVVVMLQVIRVAFGTISNVVLGRFYSSKIWPQLRYGGQVLCNSSSTRQALQPSTKQHYSCRHCSVAGLMDNPSSLAMYYISRFVQYPVTNRKSGGWGALASTLMR